MPIEPFLWEWGSLLLRWTHVIAAIAWIGSSFYFVHLDLSLIKGDDAAEREGIVGEAWQVHGGGFYRMRKYGVAPPELPKELTWFKWESYATWASGFALLVWIYYAQASLYLVDPAVLALPAPLAAAIGIAALALGWLAYDRMCKSPLGRNDLALGMVGFVFLVAVAFGFTLVFGGRGAFIHTGAVIATIMTANVAMLIIPNQRIVVADLIAGRKPDPALGLAAKQRSLHNNYLTLPVLFLMLANHYPLAFASRWNWLIVALVIVAGGVIRHFYNCRHARKASPWWTWGVAAAAMALAVWLGIVGAPGLSLAAGDPAGGAAAAPGFAEAVEAIRTRCVVCHAAEPAWDGIATAPKAVRLESEADIARQAEAIRVQAVLSQAMPPNNITEMTADERRAVAVWLRHKRQTADR
jgi:uncharacterized membrane protein